MALIKHNRTSTLAQAKTSYDPDTLYFPTDASAIVLNRKEYGETTEVLSRLGSVEGQVSTATAAAQTAASKADAAAAQASDAAQYLETLQDTIDNLYDGTEVSAAVAARVAQMDGHVVEIIDLRAVEAGDTIKDSKNAAIEAGKCHFVYSNGDDQAPRVYACETAVFDYNGTYYVIAKFRVGSTSSESGEYKYWVFFKDSTHDMYQCSAVYNENTLPSYLKAAVTTDVITTKASKVTTATAGHIAGLSSDGNLTDSGIAAKGIVVESYQSVQLSDSELIYPLDYTFPNAVITISTQDLYASLEYIRTTKKMPYVTFDLSGHTSGGYKVLLTKDWDGNYVGTARGKNGRYTVTVSIGTTTQTITCASLPAIERRELAQDIKTSLAKADAIEYLTTEEIQILWDNYGSDPYGNDTEAVTVATFGTM